MVKKKGVMIPLDDRRKMVDHHDQLSISQQCRLLSINRSALYYKPCTASDDDLKIMREMDELYLNDPAWVPVGFPISLHWRVLKQEEQKFAP